MLGKLKRLVAVLAAVAVLALPAPALAYTQTRNIVSGGHGALSPSYLVVHETANPGASAWNHVLYWGRNASTAATTQYVMDVDGSVVYQVMEADRLAWHVGGGNRYSYGIELCHAVTRSDFERQWGEAAQWCADQLRSREWGIDRLVSHDEARRLWGGTDHTDPVGYFAKYGRSWAQFETEVSARMRGGSDSSAASGGGGAAAGGTGFAGGMYRCNVAALNVRSGPGLGYAVVAGYGRGQTVVLDSWYTVRDGYVWGRYTGYSGKVRYVAVGLPTGKPEAGDYLVRVGGTSATARKSADRLALEVIRGDWGNGSARRDRLRSAGHDYEAVQSLVNRMLAA